MMFGRRFFIYVFSFSLFLVFLNFGLFADEVFLKNGNRLTGKVAQEEPEFIVLQVSGGRIKILRSEIRKIQIETPNPEAEKQVETPVDFKAIPSNFSRPKPVKFDLWGFLTEKVNQIFQKQANPSQSQASAARTSTNAVGFSQLTSLKTGEWLLMIAKEAFGSEFQKRINQEQMTRFSFFLLVGLGIFSFVIKWLVSLLGSRCAVWDAFLFQMKLITSGLVMTLLIKGALPLVILLIPVARTYIATVEMVCLVITILSIAGTFFYLAKQSLELIPWKAVVFLFLICAVAVGAKFVFEGFISPYISFK